MGSNLQQATRAMRMLDQSTASDIVETVAGNLGLSKEQILDRKKHQEAFQLTVYLLRPAANLASLGCFRSLTLEGTYHENISCKTASTLVAVPEWTEPSFLASRP